MTKPEIRGNLEEMLDRVSESRIKSEEEEKKLKELILLKDEIIIELDNKYNFDRMCLSIEKFDDILPYLIDYIKDPNPEIKKSLIKKDTEFFECYREL